MNYYYCPSRIDGIGVFASQLLEAGAEIDTAPFIVLPVDHFRKWEEPTPRMSGGVDGMPWFLIGGCFMWLNHGQDPNAEVTFLSGLASLKAIREIEMNQEILIDYDYPPDDCPPWWRARHV